MKLSKDNIWLWGQAPGSHHVIYPTMPGENKMTPIEGCEALGIENCCRVVMNNLPAVADFEEEATKLDELKNVVWSITGSWGSDRNDQGCGDLEEVIKLAKNHPNITGGVLDDFLTEKRRNVFSPDDLRKFKQRMVDEVGRAQDLWVVVYDFELDQPIDEHLKACDVITFWSWYPASLAKLEENLQRLKKVLPDKRFYCGCYLWDYGNLTERKLEDFAAECEAYKRLIENKELDGIIFCANCSFDIGLETYDFLKKWLAENVA